MAGKRESDGSPLTLFYFSESEEWYFDGRMEIAYKNNFGGVWIKHRVLFGLSEQFMIDAESVSNTQHCNLLDGV